MADGSPRIEAGPAKAMADEPVTVRASGFSPGEKVTLRARTEDILPLVAHFAQAMDWPGVLRPGRRSARVSRES